MKIIDLFEYHDPQDDFISQRDLDQLEYYLDNIFKVNNIDFEFTKHFLQRVNDPRNRKQITLKELAALFTKLQNKYGSKLSTYNRELQAVMKDMQTDINCPFVLQFNNRTGMIDLITKTVMRKPNFKTSGPVYKV